MSGDHNMNQKPEVEPAPGYCKHCKRYTVEEPLQAKQEPVAWAYQWKNGKDRSWTVTVARWPESDEWHEYPLYTAPQPKAEQEQELVAITENTSDGYHTFKELYAFRKAYNAALFNEWGLVGKFQVHKSWRHHDGELCFGGGWFIVVAVLPDGQISNHYEAKDWDLFNVQETDKALFEFDGHTGADVIARLEAYRGGEQSTPQRPPNCGTGFCSCIECPYAPPKAEPEQEPVGEDRVMTVVYRDPSKDDVQSFLDHPKAVWWGWCHAPYQRDDARCKLEKTAAAPKPTKRVPLTDEEILAIGRELGLKCRLGGNPNIDFDYARAIEAAHGITGETK